MRVLLVEDSKILAERLIETLNQVPGVVVVGTADTEGSAVAMTRDHDVDALILDLQLREGTGFGVLRTLGKGRPPVIVLTNFALPNYYQHAKQLGVEQFLDKGKDFERLPEVLQSLQQRPPEPRA